MNKKIITGVTLGIIGAGAIATLAVLSAERVRRVFDESDEVCGSCNVKGCPNRRGVVSAACRHAGLYCMRTSATENEGEAIRGCNNCGESCGACGNSCPKHKGTFPEPTDGADEDWTNLEDLDFDDSEDSIVESETDGVYDFDDDEDSVEYDDERLIPEPEAYVSTEDADATDREGQ